MTRAERRARERVAAARDAEYQVARLAWDVRRADGVGDRVQRRHADPPSVARRALWSWHVAQVAAAREAAIRECVAVAEAFDPDCVWCGGCGDVAPQFTEDSETCNCHAGSVAIDRLRALLPSPVAGDAPGADTTEGGKDG